MVRLAAARLAGNDLERFHSAIPRDEANFNDIPDRRVAVVDDSCGPKSQQRHILERSYRVTRDRHTRPQECIHKH
jgi:hypothetical protein